MTIVDDIVHAALAEFSEVGIRRTSVDDVARRVGLGRATVYRHIGGKDRLIELVVENEMVRANTELDTAISGCEDVAKMIEVAFAFLIRFTRDHPVFDQVLRREPDLLVPALTIRGASVLAFYRSMIADRLRELKDSGRVDPVDLDRVAEAFARLAISFVLTPGGVVNSDDPDAVGIFAREILLPMLGAQASTQTLPDEVSSRA
ncbi:TetR/AcrR family transcriptional regulator [Nocardia tengchongensis]